MTPEKLIEILKNRILQNEENIRFLADEDNVAEDAKYEQGWNDGNIWAREDENEFLVSLLRQLGKIDG